MDNSRDWICDGCSAMHDPDIWVCPVCGHEQNPENSVPFELWVERNPDPGFDLSSVEPDDLASIVLDNDIYRYIAYLMGTTGFREEGIFFKEESSRWLEVPRARRSTARAEMVRSSLNRASSEGFEDRNPPPPASILDAENEIRKLRGKLEFMESIVQKAENRYENAEALIAVMIRAREAGNN